MLLSAFFSFLATICFGILVNIKGKKLLYAAINGGITWLVYSIMIYFYDSPTLSFFVAAMVAAIYSELMARILKAPVTLFVICGIIPLVPGSGMYKTMLETIQGRTDLAFLEGMRTIASAGSIAVGIFVVSIFANIVSYWHRKVKGILNI